MGEETNQAESGLARKTTRAASCPRCGYDLEGARAAWTNSCPLSGVCSECGYGFEWADVLREDRQQICWLYEHASAWWRLDAAFRTLVMALNPRRFWRVHQPQIAPSPRRLMLWPIVLWGAMLSLCTVLTLIVFGSLDLVYGAWPMRWVRGVPVVEELSLRDYWFALRALLPVRVFEYPTVNENMVGVKPTAQLFLMCLTFNTSAAGICMIGRSYRVGTRVRSRHLLRIVATGLAPAVVHLLLSMIAWAWLHASGVITIMTGVWTGTGFPMSPPEWLERVYVRRTFYLDDLLALAWLLWWWWSALQIGLRFRRPLPLWAAAMITGILVCILLGLRTSLAIYLLA